MYSDNGDYCLVSSFLLVNGPSTSIHSHADSSLKLALAQCSGACAIGIGVRVQDFSFIPSKIDGFQFIPLKNIERLHDPNMLARTIVCSSHST